MDMFHLKKNKFFRSLTLIASSPQQSVEKHFENIHSIHKHQNQNYLSTAICRVQLAILPVNIILNRILQTQTSSNTIEIYISLPSSYYSSKK